MHVPSQRSNAPGGSSGASRDKARPTLRGVFSIGRIFHCNPSFTAYSSMRIVAPMQIRATLLALFLSAGTIQPAHTAETLPAPVEAPADDVLNGQASSVHDLVNKGMSYLGIRYRFGGTSPETGLDCSGLVQNVFRNAIGLDLPRTAREMASLGDKIGRQDLKPGDLVFFNTMRRAFSHVGIYVGDGQFLHAPSRGGGVRVEDMGSSYWAKRFNGARRLLDEESNTTDLPTLAR